MMSGTVKEGSCLDEGRWRVTFTAPRSFVDKLDEIRALMSHAAPHAELAEVLEQGLDALRERLLKRRWGAATARLQAPLRAAAGQEGRADEPLASGTAAVPQTDPTPASSLDAAAATAPEPPPRSIVPPAPATPGAERPRVDARPPSRHVPAQVRAAVYLRDTGRCTFVDEQGRRCPERRFVQVLAR